MFEKEAEEYVLGNFSSGYYGEFEMEEITEYSAFQKGAEFGYSKANEWHYVKDGDLPEKEDIYLIYTIRGYLLGHYEQGGADGKVDYCGEPYSDFTEYPSEEELVANEVIAWCEIPTFDKEQKGVVFH